MISTDYIMTFGYGRTDPPYGTTAFPYHRGDDWYMPDGTPIVVNGVQIGISGHSGFVTGPHCHIGRFISGTDTDPNSQGWSLKNPHVTDIGYDDTNGNYVGLLDASGVRWVYLHMQEKSTNVKVGDYLDSLPKYEEQDMNPNAGDVTNAYQTANKRDATQAEIDVYVAKPWNAPDGLVYGKLFVDLEAAQKAASSGDGSASTLKPGVYKVEG